MPCPSNTADKFMLRFPEGMRKELKVEAAKNDRSLNAELINRLKKSLEAEKKEVA